MRFNLVLFGLARVRVREELKSSPYRKARVEILAERPSEGPDEEPRRRSLLGIYAKVIREMTQGALPQLPGDVPLGLLSDLLASLISLGPLVRQGLLEELDVTRRVDRLLAHLEGAAGTRPGARRAWPPGSSLN